MRPSEYFQRPCWIVLEPDELMAAFTVEFVGAGRFLWGSDNPHTEKDMGALQELKENLGSLSENDRNLVLGQNAISLYGL